MAYCRNCGKEIDDNAKFCRYCGNKVGVTSNNSTPEPDETTKTAVEVVENENVGVENIQNISVAPDGGAVLKKKKSKAPLIIVVIVVVLAGLFAAFWFLLKPILFKNNDVIPKNLFNDGLLSAMSEQGGKWGYIDEKGNFAIEAQFDAVTEFSDKYGLIDASGKWVVSAKYDSMYYLDNGLYSVKKGAKWGIVNNKKYYGLAGEISNYCQYDGCFNTVSISDSDKLGITKPDKYCSQEIARNIYIDVNSEIADMIVNGETITGDVPYSNLVVKMVDCSDMNVTDKLSKCVVDSCNDVWNDQKTKGYAVVWYFTDTGECTVFWGHDEKNDLNVGAYSSVSGSLQNDAKGKSLDDIYNIIITN